MREGYSRSHFVVNQESPSKVGDYTAHSILSDEEPEES